jgi:transmembrane sensor
MLVMGSALGVLVGVFVVLWSGWREPTRTAESAPVAALPSATIQGPSNLDFGETASLRVETGGRVDVLERSPAAVSLALRAGLARIDIRPGGHQKWQIDCGSVTVEVVGTRFVLERKEQWVRVEVERGRVLVRGEGVVDHVQAVDAGHHLVVDGRAVEPAPAPSKAAAAPKPSSASAPNEWRTAAQSREWKRAWEALGEGGVAREAARADDVGDLLTLADIARLSGHPYDAIAPLQRVVKQHTRDERASLAAFTLGRVLLDSTGDPGAAARALEQALALRLPATLAEDAEARLVEAYARAGDKEQARARADAYRARYPAGRRAADVERWSQF